MVLDQIFDGGEQEIIESGLDGRSVEIGLYDDSTDDLQPADDFTAITTIPQNGAYTPNAQALSLAVNDNQNAVAENSESITFDFSDVLDGDTNAQDVNAAYVKLDGSNTLIANPSMTTNRNTGAFDELKIAAQDFQVGINGQAGTSADSTTQ